MALAHRGAVVSLYSDRSPPPGRLAERIVRAAWHHGRKAAAAESAVAAARHFDAVRRVLEPWRRCGAADGTARVAAAWGAHDGWLVRVETPAGTVGVRGTEFVLSHDEGSGGSSLYMLEGLVAFGAQGCEKTKTCQSGSENDPVPRNSNSVHSAPRFWCDYVCGGRYSAVVTGHQPLFP